MLQMIVHNIKGMNTEILTSCGRMISGLSIEKGTNMKELDII